MPEVIDTLYGEPRPLMNFYLALKQVATGGKIFRVAWQTSDEYIFIDGEVLKIHHADGRIDNLIVSLGDMTGEDWVLI